MNQVDMVALLVLLIVVGAAVAYIVREKRRGVKCIGCSVGKSCSQNAKAAYAGGCSCSASGGCSSEAAGECPASKMAASLRVSE